MSMKKIKEWANLCTDDTIRKKWIENARQHSLSDWRSNTIVDNMATALEYSFSWRDSHELYGYWDSIYMDMRNNPEKYLKKRKVMFHEFDNN